MPDLLLPRTLGSVFTRAEALRAGLTSYRLRRMLEAGVILQAARGVYFTEDLDANAETWQLVRAEHLGRCRRQLAIHPSHVLSHQSAAVAHDLQILIHPAMDVHLTAVNCAPRSRRFEGVQLHHADSVANETVIVDDLPVTTVPRTIADVLRTSRPPHSVPVLDAAVRAEQTSLAAVKHCLDEQVRWRGRPRALAAVLLADPRRESWLESYSFVRLHELGLPLPLPQVEVLDGGFHLVGRVDGLLGATFLEADGAGKYLLDCEKTGMSPTESTEQKLAAQRTRHNALLDLGLTGARWSTSEIRNDAETVARRVQEARRQSDPARFRGWCRLGGHLFRPGDKTSGPTRAC